MILLPAQTPAHLAAVRELFTEYAASLPFSLCFQGFDAELATLPGKYAPPAGRLILAFDSTDSGTGVPPVIHSGSVIPPVSNTPIGCIALRPLDPGICEMKRLYTRPPFRARGLGRLLCEHLIAQARSIGYKAMRLDTSADMIPAQRLYRSLGFTTIPRYNNDPLEDTIYMELRL